MFLTIVFVSIILSISGISVHNAFADEIIMKSTMTTNSTHTITPATNATIINSTLLSHSVSLTDTISKSTNSSQKTLLVKKSWDFNTLTDVSKNQASNAKSSHYNAGSLQLTGQEYIKESVNSTASLSALSISVWIKPDYSHGSPQFTIITKEKGFLLAINKNLPPTKKAIFSIFDGIRWNTITSKSDISEEWTNLVATFNGSSIALYVNGTLESSVPLKGEPTITIDGHLATKTVIELSSNPDIVIGTYYDSIRETRYNSFSGNIENINLYASPLSAQQISQLYHTDIAKLGEFKSNLPENQAN